MGTRKLLAFDRSGAGFAPEGNWLPPTHAHRAGSPGDSAHAPNRLRRARLRSPGRGLANRFDAVGSGATKPRPRRNERPMQRRFEGRKFMVTGAGTGFGAELSVRAAEEGAALVLIHYRRSQAGAERTAERVRNAGAETELVQGDITSWSEVKRMAAFAFGEAGGIDVLVNNVGEMASAQSSWEE